MKRITIDDDAYRALLLKRGFSMKSVSTIIKELIAKRNKSIERI